MNVDRDTVLGTLSSEAAASAMLGYLLSLPADQRAAIADALERRAAQDEDRAKVCMGPAKLYTAQGEASVAVADAVKERMASHYRRCAAAGRSIAEDLREV